MEIEKKLSSFDQQIAVNQKFIQRVRNFVYVCAKYLSYSLFTDAWGE